MKKTIQKVKHDLSLWYAQIENKVLIMVLITLIYFGYIVDTQFK